MSDFDDLFGEWQTSVVVRLPIGEGMEGTVFDSPTIMRCNVESKRRLVRDSTGREVVSETTLFVPASEAPKIALHAQVQLLDGTKTTALVVEPPLAPELFDHTVVRLA